MGERNKYTEAIILTVQIQGENNRLVSVLSPDEGIFYCVLYGGPKSRFRSIIQPFNSGTLYYYEDSIKKQRKITDFDVKNYHPTFSTNIYKMWAANLSTEIVIKTKCAGDTKSAFTLLKAVTDGMDACPNEDDARLGMLRFLWRYIGLLGVQMNVNECPVCNCSILAENQKNNRFVYSPYYNGFICPDCSSFSTDDFIYSNFSLDQGALTYLNAINELSPRQVRQLHITATSAYDLKRFLYYIIEKEVGSLKSIESGNGIL